VTVNYSLGNGCSIPATDFVMDIAVDTSYDWQLYGPFAAGAVVTVSWTAESHSGTPTSNQYLANLYGPTEGQVFQSFYTANGSAHSFTGTLANSEAFLSFGLGANGTGTVTLKNYSASISPCSVTGTGTYCTYGTRLKTGVQDVEVVTEAAIAAATVLVPELKWLEIGFGLLTGLTWIPGNVCGSQRPALPTFTSADFIFGDIPTPGSLAKWWQAWDYINWGVFCECVPATGGAPLPLPPPPPTGTQPSGVAGAPPPLVCDNSDVCATLDLITQQLNGMSFQLGLIRSDVSLIQRQGVPFAYVAGTLHSGLSGTGTITLTGPLGLVVQTTSMPGYLSSDMAPVASYFKIGELSLGTVDGWASRRIVTHNPHLYVDIGADMTRLGYLFEPGITANIQELVREP
jgi:hypothetical protein